MEVDASAATTAAYNERLKKLTDILAGETTCDLHLQFLFTNSKTDLQIINAIKVRRVMH